MPMTPSIKDGITIGVRVPGTLAKWIAVEGKALGNSSHFLRRLVEDAKDFYGLPLSIKNVLEADAERLGLSQRDYVLHLLSEKYEALLKEKFVAEAKQARK